MREDAERLADLTGHPYDDWVDAIICAKLAGRPELPADLAVLAATGARWVSPDRMVKMLVTAGRPPLLARLFGTVADRLDRARLRR